MVLILSFLFYKKEPLRPLIFYILNADLPTAIAFRVAYSFADMWNDAPADKLIIGIIFSQTNDPDTPVTGKNRWSIIQFKDPEGTYGWQEASTFDEHIYKRYRSNSTSFSEWRII